MTLSTFFRAFSSIDLRRILKQGSQTLLTLCGLFLLSGCDYLGMHGHQSTMLHEGPVAKMQWDLFMVTVVISTVIFTLVGGVLIILLIRYRERKGDHEKPLPPQGH